MENKTFKPYIPASKVLPELTFLSIFLGSLLAIVFGGANAYLGLKVGMTISASIPAAVISMGIIRKILKKDSILENNMVQTIASSGESLAAGVCFTLPVMFMWAKEGLTATPTLLTISVISIIGGMLGIFFMIPLRSALIVKEHGTLAYPEGQACAEVLIAGEKGGAKANTVFSGLGIAALYKFIADGLKIFPSSISWDIPKNVLKGAGFGMDVVPALAGVGYICGVKVSSYLFAGGTLAWFVLMPLIAMFGNDIVIFPATVSVAEVYNQGGAAALWSNYIKYIGAGAVAAGGIISLVKTLPMIVRAFKDAIKGYGQKGENTLRTEQDLSFPTLVIGVLVTSLFMWLSPTIPVDLLGALIIVVFGFFFATVSSRMVGLIGSSNNPVSGMTIATLLFATVILKATGSTGINGMIGAISIGSIICIIAAMAGDASQDLKTGFLVGATPKKQQIGEIIGCVVSALAIGAILYLLDAAWGFGSSEIAAPQATLMKLIVEGVMEGNLPWALVLMGVFVAVVIEVLGIPVLPVAIGLYLPISLSTPIMAGGLLRWWIEKRKTSSEEEREEAVQSGVLFSSGLIAGEGLIGIILAVLAVVTVGGTSLGDKINLSAMGINIGQIGSVFCFAALLYLVYLFAVKGGKRASK
ncbi:MAG: oligopeptide transporter, OPT family [Eubacteriales bacterium]|nr:oligopeptide transporter, OPT family [Eubacteriales bacterium]